MSRLADLPSLIEQEQRILLGLKDDKAKIERRKRSIEARLWLSDEIKGMKPLADREAGHLLACEADPDWIKHTDRLDNLRRTIAKHEAQRDLLRREREGVRIALEHASRIDWKRRWPTRNSPAWRAGAYSRDA